MRHLIFGRKYVQQADLNNSLFINNIASPVVMNGKVTLTTDHKGGNTAIQFGSGNLVSVDNLPASPVWSIAFWLKTSSTANTIMFELSPLLDKINGFLSTINNDGSGKIRGYINGSNTISANYKYTNNAFNNGVWNHVVIILDRNKTATNEVEIYINKVKQLLTSSLNNDQTGNFTSEKIYIGGRGNTFTSPLNGATSPFKLYNYSLTQTEIDNLYNE